MEYIEKMTYLIMIEIEQMVYSISNFGAEFI